MRSAVIFVSILFKRTWGREPALSVGEYTRIVSDVGRAGSTGVPSDV